MSTTQKATSRAQLRVSATIIFTSREMKQYQRWQRLYTTLELADHGYVPTAIEYEDFQLWLRKQDSGYFSDIFEDVANHVKPIELDSTTSIHETPVAYLCRHHMHPSAIGLSKPRCPVCVIDLHLNYMGVLTRILQSAGGRAPSCTLQASEYQENVYRVWSSEKLSTIQQLSKLEELAEQEQEWSAKRPEAQQMFDDTKTAQHALELYWSEMGATCLETKSSKQTRKTVSFTKDTEDGPGRPQEYYWRRSPRYEPGKYTCDISHEEIAVPRRHVFGLQNEEEDIVSEDSEDYSQAPMPTLLEAPNEPPLTQHLVQDTEDSPRDDESFDEVQDDDGDSDWEDIESDDEDSDTRNGDGRDFIFFEDIDECSFVVFSDD